jgi:uncharacterized protein (TIGR02594 family)
MTDPILQAYQDYANKVQSESRPVIVNDKFPSAVILIASILLCGIICLFSSCGMTPARADIIAVAQSQIGLGEIGGNNKGIYVRQYLGGRENLPWCAGFVSYCAKNSGIKIPYLLRAKDFVEYGSVLAPIEVRKGDLVVFHRLGGGHVGIIESKKGDYFVSIEGNVGKYPARVKRVKHHIFENGIYRFVRIQKARS